MQFIKKTSSSRNFFRFTVKLTLGLFIAIIIIFFLNKIDFPVPKKEIEKIISNENFKIVK
tara:strand:- start:1946 stop:2125 length:180 start_codon:yes stop_codon:yes gene_type:complete